LKKLQAAADLINNAKKPYIVFGVKESFLSEAEAELKEL
jgi:thiamine pyrophosphate-dependent acetolactate synthase large subunit-like protein